MIKKYISQVHEIVNDKTDRNIEVIPQDEKNPSEDFLVLIDDEIFPAILVNLPCNVETYKTTDHVTYFKGGDVGQMVQVCSCATEREQVRANLRHVEGNFYYPNGLTPPTTNIVKRRYEKVFHYGPYPNFVVKGVAQEIIDFKDDDIVETYEEVVDFEPWMADADHPDGNCYRLSGLEWNDDTMFFQNHPEMLQSKFEESLAEDCKKIEPDRKPEGSLLAFEAAVRRLKARKPTLRGGFIDLSHRYKVMPKKAGNNDMPPPSPGPSPRLAAMKKPSPLKSGTGGESQFATDVPEEDDDDDGEEIVLESGGANFEDTMAAGGQDGEFATEADEDDDKFLEDLEEEIVADSEAAIGTSMNVSVEKPADEQAADSDSEESWMKDLEDDLEDSRVDAITSSSSDRIAQSNTTTGMDLAEQGNEPASDEDNEESWLKDLEE